MIELGFLSPLDIQLKIRLVKTKKTDVQLTPCSHNVTHIYNTLKGDCLMAYYCFKCRNELDLVLTAGVKVGRLDTCAHCDAYLHACKNCRFYDPSLHNQCRIPEADFIRDRETSNFCHHFDILDRHDPPVTDDSVDKAKAKLNELFKNLT